MKRTLSAAAAACGARLDGSDRQFNAVSTDSRTLARGDLFVAFKGERFDGHDFLSSVARAGAAGAIVQRVVQSRPEPNPLLTVGWDAMAVAAYHAQTEWPIVRLLVGDDAPQWTWLTEELALCWVHEGRHYKKLTPWLAAHRVALSDFLSQFWDFYVSIVAREWLSVTSDD